MTYTLGALFDGSDPLPGQRLLPTGHEPYLIASSRDLDMFIAGLIEEYGSHAAFTFVREAPVNAGNTYPEESLTFAVRADGEAGGLKLYDGNTVWYARGSDGSTEVSYSFFGNSQMWPADSQIPLASVKTAVDSFRASGGKRPDLRDGEWAPWPANIPV